MELKPGTRLRSVVCGAEFVVVRPVDNIKELRCGGQALVPSGGKLPEGVELDAVLADGIQVGKRYFDEASGLELLASKPGRGTLQADGRKMSLKQAKPLPASD